MVAGLFEQLLLLVGGHATGFLEVSLDGLVVQDLERVVHAVELDVLLPPLVHPSA